MNARVRFALYTATLLAGVIYLTSCAVRPSPEPMPIPVPEPAAAPMMEEAVVTATYRSAEAARGVADAARGALHSTRALAADELWIVTKAAPEPSPDQARSSDPGTGSMLVSRPGDDPAEPTQRVPLPLQHTAVDAAIAGYIGTVQVKQRFANPFDTKIEAVYVFPLPEKAAVSEFLMVIGDRTIRGILREKEEAEAIYRHARNQGYQASLLVQRRPNIFEQKVANIEPGKGIDVDITYFHTLAYKDGWYSFVFPTVVGPRYNPPGHPDPVAPLPRGGRGRIPGSDRRGVPRADGTLRARHRHHRAPRRRRGPRGTELDPRDHRRRGRVRIHDRETGGRNHHSQPRLRARFPGAGGHDQVEAADLPGSRDGRRLLHADGHSAPRRHRDRAAADGDGVRPRLFRLHERAPAGTGQGSRRHRPRPPRAARHLPDRSLLRPRLPVRPGTGACNRSEPRGGAPLPGRARQRRRHGDAAGHRGGPRLPAEPVALPLRHVHDRRLHRQRGRHPGRRAPAPRRRPHLQLRRRQFGQSLPDGADGEGGARGRRLSRAAGLRRSGDGELFRSRQPPRPHRCRDRLGWHARAGHLPPPHSPTSSSAGPWSWPAATTASPRR